MDRTSRRGRGRASSSRIHMQQPDEDISSQFTDPAISTTDSSSEATSSIRRAAASSRGRGRLPRSQPEYSEMSSELNTTPIHTSSSSGKTGSGTTGQKSTDSESFNISQQYRQDKREVQALELATKQAPGGAGRHVHVTSNFFKTKFNRLPNAIFQYQFESEYEEEKAKFDKQVSLPAAMAFFNAWQRTVVNESSSSDSGSSTGGSSDHHLPPLAYYDGRHLVYSFEQLEEGVTTVDFKYERTAGQFRARLTQTRDLSQVWKLSQERMDDGVAVDPIVMQVYEVMLKHKLCLGHAKVGPNFYPSMSPDLTFDQYGLGNGKMAMKGFNISLKHTVSGLAIQAKNKLGAFYKPIPLLDFLQEHFRREDVTDRRFWADRRHREKALKFCKGLQVNIERTSDQHHIAKTRKINDISAEAAADLRFKVENSDGGLTSQNVADYYRRQHQTLRFPHLPCINARGRNASRKEFYPLEFCRLVARQPVKGKLDDQEVANMIKMAALPAPQTFKEIKSSMAEAKQVFENDFRKAGVEIDEKMMKVGGRILEAPAIQYGDGNADTRSGAWNPRMFINAASAKKWTACFLREYGGRDQHQQESTVWRFCDMLKHVGYEMGMDMNDVSHVNVIEYNPDTLRDYLYWCKKEEFDFVLVGVEKKFSNLYPSVKRFAERECGVLTQCMVLKTMEKANSQLCKMVLAKINAKLGGISCVVDLKMAAEGTGLFQQAPVMVQALDLNVQAGGSDGPVIAALASSHDQGAACFNMVARMSDDPCFATRLKEMQVEALKNFFAITRSKPQAIIFFRPGCNESEMARIMTLEYKAILDACLELETDYRPKITYIIATKRHNTRFASQDPNLSIGKSQNVPAGMVVDRDVVSVDKFDFYLQSSQGIQGTSIPTHYYVLKDDNDLNADSAQGLCYYLCHGFARCNRTISLPNAMKYAQLAAARARNWTKDGIQHQSQEEYYVKLAALLDTSQKLLDENGNPIKKNSLRRTCFFY